MQTEINKKMRVKTTMKNYLILGTAICSVFLWPKFMFGVIVGALLTAFCSRITIEYSDKNEGSQT